MFVVEGNSFEALILLRLVSSLCVSRTECLSYVIYYMSSYVLLFSLHQIFYPSSSPPTMLSFVFVCLSVCFVFASGLGQCLFVSDREHELHWMILNLFNLIFWLFGGLIVGISVSPSPVKLCRFLGFTCWESFMVLWCLIVPFSFLSFFFLSLFNPSSIVCAVGSFGWDLSYVFRSAHLGCQPHAQQGDGPSWWQFRSPLWSHWRSIGLSLVAPYRWLPLT